MTRRGVSLAEMVIALALGGVVLSAFARSMSAHRRAESRVSQAHRASAGAEEVVRVSTALLSRLARGDPVWIRGDTAIEWRATVGIALACVAGGDSVVVPDGGHSAWWDGTPDSGDALDLEGDVEARSLHEIMGVTWRGNGGACGGAQYTLRLRQPLPWSGVGAARATRRTRLALYRGGDGAWWLGERRCPGAGADRCGAAQPVAGPLDRPPLGLTFALDGSGVITIAARADGVARIGAVMVQQ